MRAVIALIVLSLSALADNRAISRETYHDKVLGAWTGQIVGAIFGWPFEGKPANVKTVDHYLKPYSFAPVDDDYYYEMIALYGFERFGTGMTVEQLGDVWKDYQAGSWGSSEQARLALERGIKAPETGSPRYNRWFHTIGPQFSADIYGMLAPGMVNVAGRMAREYSHVNGYGEGSDGAVFIAACVSEAFFENKPERIVRQAAQLIQPLSNYRKAIDQVLEGYDNGKGWKQLASETEARWRPDYPQMNNAVANGALVAIGLLYGKGDFLDTLNIITQAGDFTDADCNAANAGAILGAMHGTQAIPRQLVEPLHDRIYGEQMGPVKFRKPVDEKISDLAERIVKIGTANVEANGGTVEARSIVVPRRRPETQPYEKFDINEYASLWDRNWKLEGGGRGGAGATYLDGDTLVTFPRDSRPCRLEATFTIPSRRPTMTLTVRSDAGKPWRLDVYANNERLITQTIDGAPEPVIIDLSHYAGQTALLRAFHYQIDGKPPSEARWRSIVIQ